MRSDIARYLADGNAGQKLSYAFIRDVARAYMALGPHDGLHQNRRAACRNAVVSVFNKMPHSNLPYNGNADTAVQHTLPALECVLKMPPTRPPKPSILLMTI